MVILSIPVVWTNKEVPNNFKTIVLFWLILKDWLKTVHTFVATFGEVPITISSIIMLIGLMLEADLEQYIKERVYVPDAK